MNFDRAQRPYVFAPPRYARWFRPVLHLLSGYILRFRFNIRSVTVRGEQPLVQLSRQGESLLVTPNHADHADPAILVEVGRRHRLAFHFMAAREGFERGNLQRFILQRSGAFSVDREGADLASVRTAINILRECRHPLVIFPEGEIYHHHEELDLLNDGVATILLRSAAKLPPGKKCYVVAAGIRITHDASVEATFSPRLDALERRITWKPRPHLKVVERIYSLGAGLLSIKEEEFTGASRKGDLVERIGHLQRYLVEQVEQRHGIRSEGPCPSRIRALRKIIRRELTEAGPPLGREREASLYDDLDRLFAAQQLYSYPGQYVRVRPTLDRIAETLFKLEEDVMGKGTYPAPRRADICFGEPIDVEGFLRANCLDAKSGNPHMTELLRERIDALLKAGHGG